MANKVPSAMPISATPLVKCNMSTEPTIKYNTFAVMLPIKIVMSTFRRW